MPDKVGIRSQLLSFGFCALFAVSCLLGACATQADLDMLRQDVNRLQSDSMSTKNELQNLKEKTTGVAKEESFNAVRMSQSEIQSQLANVSKDLQTLNGRFDENKYFVEKTLKASASETDAVKAQMTDIENQIKEIKDRLSALEGRLGQGEQAKAPEAEAKAGAPPEKQAKEGQPSKSEKLSMYEAAYNAFKDKKYKEAREKFEAFIKEFPKDELVENANFWIAETLDREKDYEGAILAYESFLKKYPKSRKAPSALLKQGLAFLDIGDGKTGKVILEQVLERYPKSTEAELAKKALKKPGRKNVKNRK